MNKNVLILNENMQINDVDKNIDTIFFNCDFKNKNFLMSFKNLNTVNFNNCQEIEPALCKYLPITNLYLGNTVNKIGAYSFNYTKLKKIEISKNVTFIGSYAFSDCSLKNVNFNNEQALTISPYAFSNNNIESLYLNNIELIDLNSFYNNFCLKNIELKNVKQVSERAFVNCNNIQRFTFDFNTNITNLVLPQSCTVNLKLGEDVVFECNSNSPKIISSDNNNVYILCDKKVYVCDGKSVDEYKAYNWTNLYQPAINYLKALIEYNRKNNKKNCLPDYQMILRIPQIPFDNFYNSYNTFEKLFKKTGLESIYKSSFFYFCNKLGLFHYTTDEQKDYKIRAKVCDFIRQLKEENFNFIKLVNNEIKFIGGYDKDFVNIFMTNYQQFFENIDLFDFFVKNYKKLALNKKNKYGKNLVLSYQDVYDEYVADLNWIEPKYKQLALELKKSLGKNLNFESYLTKAIKAMDMACELELKFKKGEEKDFFGFIEDKNPSNEFSYYFMKRDNPKVVSVAYDCDCCSTFGKKGESILEQIMTNPNVGLLVIKDKEGNNIAKSTIYLNVEKNICFANNFEVKKAFLGDIENNIIGYATYTDKQNLYLCFKRALKEFVCQYNERFFDNKIKKVLVGDNYNKLLHYLLTDANIEQSNKVYNFMLGDGYLSNNKQQFVIYDSNKDEEFIN